MDQLNVVVPKKNCASVLIFISHNLPYTLRLISLEVYDLWNLLSTELRCFQCCIHELIEGLYGDGGWLLGWRHEWWNSSRTWQESWGLLLHCEEKGIWFNPDCEAPKEEVPLILYDMCMATRKGIHSRCVELLRCHLYGMCMATGKVCVCIHSRCVELLRCHLYDMCMATRKGMCGIIHQMMLQLWSVVIGSCTVPWQVFASSLRHHKTPERDYTEGHRPSKMC